LPNEILKDSAASNIIVEGSNLKLIQAANEKELIISTLRKVNYNKSKAARMLNIDRKTLYNKIKQYGIEI
jgi:two-component system, NtrC family, response regulator HydG